MSTRPFNFKINAAEFFSVVDSLHPKQRSSFLVQFSKDLLTLEPKTDYGKRVVSKTLDLIKKQSDFGKLGGRPKQRHPKGTLKAPLRVDKGTPKPEVEVEVEVEEKEKEKKKKNIFIPPSPQETQAYMDEINFKGDGEYFVDFYQARGWKTTGGKMSDWKATVRNWKRRDLKNKPTQEQESFSYVR